MESQICECPGIGDFGNDGNCNQCLKGIICNGCGRLPCECMSGEEWLSMMRYYEEKERQNENH